MITAKILFNGQETEFVLVEFIALVPDASGSDDGEYQESFHKEITWLDSNYIVNELVGKSDLIYKNVNQISFQVKDGFVVYEARDNSGIVKIDMIPLSYVTNIKCGRNDLSQQQEMRVLSKEEKRRAR